MGVAEAGAEIRSAGLMFRVEMLPAAHGDCLWIEYGDPDDPRRVLIDAGPPFTSTYQVLVDRIRALPPAHRVFELFVVTHIDADHIGGAIRLLRDAAVLGAEFRRIWFNGYDQLHAHPVVRGFLGAAQGEYLSLLVQDYEQRIGAPVLNLGLDDGLDDGLQEGGPSIGDRSCEPPGPLHVDEWAGSAPGSSASAGRASLPIARLPGGLDLTVLSPGVDELIALAVHWAKVVEELGFRSEAGPLAAIRDQLESSAQLRPLLAATGEVAVLGQSDAIGAIGAGAEPPPIPATFGVDVLGSSTELGSDRSEANGSSIALLAEHKDGSALLAGDAFASRLAQSLTELLAARGGDRLRVGAFKLPHHGSAGNVSAELLDLISTKHYLISTSGAQFGHPDAAAIEAVIAHHDPSQGKPELWFNHDTATTRPWASSDVVTAHYPKST